jgi:hypothetical protein
MNNDSNSTDTSDILAGGTTYLDHEYQSNWGENQEADEKKNNADIIVDTQTIPHKQENARRLIAVWLLSLLSLEMIFIGLSVGLGLITIDTAKDMSALLLTPTIAMTSTAIGFYFGSKN